MTIRQEVAKALRDEKMAHEWEMEVAIIDQTFNMPAKEDRD